MDDFFNFRKALIRLQIVNASVYYYLPLDYKFADWERSRIGHVVYYIVDVVKEMGRRNLTVPNVDLIFNTQDFDASNNFSINFIEHFTDAYEYFSAAHNYKKTRLKQFPPLPVLSGVQCTHSHDFSFPVTIMQNEFADWREYEKAYNRNIEIASKTPWQNRKNMAFFRGFPYPANRRIQLAQIVRQERSRIFDVCVSGNRQFCYVPVAKWGHDFKMFIHCAGSFYWSSRLSQLFLLNGTVLRQMTPCHEFWDSFFEPWVHYIPVDYDLQDIVDKVKWCLGHQVECEQIAARAFEQAKRVFQREHILQYGITLISEIAKRQNASEITIRSGALLPESLNGLLPHLGVNS